MEDSALMVDIIFLGGVHWPKIVGMPLDSYDVAWFCPQQRFSVNLLLTGVARLFAIFFVNYWASPQWLFDLYCCPSQTKQNAERLFCRATELCGANFVTEPSLSAVLWFLVFSGSMLHQSGVPARNQRLCFWKNHWAHSLAFELSSGHAGFRDVALHRNTWFERIAWCIC